MFITVYGYHFKLYSNSTKYANKHCLKFYLLHNNLHKCSNIFACIYNLSQTCIFASKQMVDAPLPDIILHDILARLPNKDLARFKCVSKHWSHLIMDPYFIKLRWHRIILLTGSPLHVLDEKIPLEDTSNLMFKIRFPFGNPKGKDVKCLGISNGIAVLVFKAYCVGDKSTYIRTILYNPFTSAYKLVIDSHCEC